MRISDIEKKAKQMGIKNTWKYSRTDLVREVQRKEGNSDCFGKAKGSCAQMACCWRTDCLK